jgi:CubicO group peptidase (beta-lactamase class C family)
MRFRSPILALLFLVAAGAQAQTSRAALISRLDSLAGAPIGERRAAGIAVVIVKGNDTLLAKGYGKADIELDVSLPADAMFEIGSVTKQFTAAAILQLRDAGKLSLDDDVSKYLPNPNLTRGKKVPLRMLLNHTSGIKGITEMPEFGPLSVSRFPKDSALALIARYPFVFEPGEAQIYNNSAFIMLGHVIEKVSGVSYEDYVEQRIFSPLGMKSSRYCHSEEVVPKRAHGYQIVRGAMQRAGSNNHTWPYSAGSLCSTAGDMVTWLKALHGGKVLSPASYAEMTSPGKLNDGTQIRYGMGLSVGRDVRGTRLIGHGGAIDGFLADASWYPDSSLAISVLINTAGGVNPSALASELAGAIIPPTRFTPVAFTGEVAPLIGKYTGAARGGQMTVEIAASQPGGPLQGITYSVNGGPAQPISWVDGWKFRTPTTSATFERSGAAGNATLLRWDGNGGYHMLKRQ